MKGLSITLAVPAVLLAGSLCTGVAWAGIDSSLRLQALPLLIPNDPENYLLDQLPEVDLESTTKLQANFDSKLTNPSFEEISWDYLAINFLLQQEYMKALQCLERANNDAEERLPYYLAFKAYALQQAGRLNDAVFIWKQQINEQEDNRPVLTQLIACDVMKRRMLAASKIATQLPEDRENESFSSYLEAIIALGRGDLFDAQHKLLRITKQPEHPAEVYLALAVSSLERGGEYDVVGWLRKLFKEVPSYQRHLVAHHPAFSPLKAHPAFQALLEEFSITSEGEVEELTPPLLAAYQDKFSLPETLRVNLLLKVQQEEVPPQFRGLKLIDEAVGTGLKGQRR